MMKKVLATLCFLGLFMGMFVQPSMAHTRPFCYTDSTVDPKFANIACVQQTNTYCLDTDTNSPTFLQFKLVSKFLHWGCGENQHAGFIDENGNLIGMPDDPVNNN